MRRKTGFAVAAFALATSLLFADDFRVGADLGWVTQLEKEGTVFLDETGAKRDCFELMRDYGVDSVRLRVWVNPKDGWNGKADTLAKAKRAKAAGMDLMIDFHYGDTWADPGQQPIPAAWRGKPVDEIRGLLAAHTRDVLSCLKENGIEPKWVQVGNETSNGMLWDPKRDAKGKATWKEVRKGVWMPETTESIAYITTQGENYAKLFKSGYEAVKSVFPAAVVIVHVTPCESAKVTDLNLETLAKGGAKWDMVGFSLYPYHSRPADVKKDPVRIPAFDSNVIANGIANCIRTAKKWKCPVMIVETGFETVPVAPMTLEYSRTMMERVLREAREHTQGFCKGVFYWEPACPEKWYPLGAFLADGKNLRPTPIMAAFRTGRDRPVDATSLPAFGLCSHQGDSGAYPGNTPEAFASGAAKGAAMIEFDLKRCKTGEIVLNHDRTVPYRGKPVNVGDLTLAELKSIDKGRGCRIPTLQEGLAAIPKNGIWINVHCGDLPEDVPLAVETVDYLKKDGRIHQAFLSAPVPTIAAARKRVPELLGNSMMYPPNCWRHLWSPEEVRDHFRIALSNRCTFVQPHMAMLSPSDCAAFKAAGGRVNYYVCNTPLRLEPMIESGVDYPLTDRLDEMIGRFRAIRRAWDAAPSAAGAVRLRLARNEKADIPYAGSAAFGVLRNVDGVVFPAGSIAVADGRLRIAVPANLPAGIYRGWGLVVHVNDFAVPDGTPAYVGPTAERGNVEAYAKVLEAAIAKVDVSKYPNWNWVPSANTIIKRVRRTDGGRFGFTDDPAEYDHWRNGLAEVIDGNCRY